MKIKILDARGKFSITSFGKVAVLFAGVVVIGAAVLSSAISVHKQKAIDNQAEIEEQKAIESAKADHKTYEDLFVAAHILTAQSEYNTVYLGEDKVPLYIGKDTVKDFIERSGFKIDWTNSSYYYNENSYNDYSRDEIITPAVFDDMPGYYLYCPGSGRFGLTIDGVAPGVVEIAFDAFDQCTISELDLDKCYINSLRISFTGNKDYSFEYRNKTVDYSREALVAAAEETNISYADSDEQDDEIYDSISFSLPEGVEVHRYYSLYKYDDGTESEYISCEISHDTKFKWGWNEFDNAFK